VTSRNCGSGTDAEGAQPGGTKSVGLTLMVLRRYRGVTLKALSKACGSTLSNLSLYEIGRAMPRHDSLVRIDKAQRTGGRVEGSRQTRRGGGEPG
jgi:Helix-turn-helix domain